MSFTNPINSTNGEVCDPQSVDVESQTPTTNIWSLARRLDHLCDEFTVFMLLAAALNLIAIFTLYLWTDGSYWNRIRVCIICFSVGMTRMHTQETKQAVRLAAEQKIERMTNDQQPGTMEPSPLSKYLFGKMAETIVRPKFSPGLAFALGFTEVICLYGLGRSMLSWLDNDNRLGTVGFVEMAILYTICRYQNERLKRMYKS